MPRFAASGSARRSTLMAQVPGLPPGDVVDLGCGDGAAAANLAHRFGGPGCAPIGETVYVQHLAPAAAGRPLRAFTASTAMRPFLAALDLDARERLVAACDAAQAGAYRAEPDGGTLFPVPRVFVVLTRAAATP